MRKEYVIYFLFMKENIRIVIVYFYNYVCWSVIKDFILMKKIICVMCVLFLVDELL